MRVVVTGATGNVGTSLVRRLVADPAVEAIVGIARRAPDWRASGLTWAEVDLTSGDDAPDVPPPALVEALRGADAVVHLAWTIQPSWDLHALQRANVVASARTWRAALETGVGTIVHASSVGAYSPHPDPTPVDETWATHGIATSSYSWQKAVVERQLDAVEAAHPDVRVVRVRPSLIFKAAAGPEVKRFFLGPFVPAELVRPGRLPVLPRGGGIRFQAVHSDDVAEAIALALQADVRGAFNLATDEVLDLADVAEVMGARTVPLPARALRGVAAATHRVRLQPTSEGWVDLARMAPVLHSGRARVELGWEPRVEGREALRRLLHGIADDEGGDTPRLSA